MKFHEVREEILKGKSIIDLPLKVVFYARVSTESDEQLNSLDNQVSFFKNFIISNKNWTYVKGYIDEGISGSTVKNRKKFLQMIEDAKSGHFDLVVTKEVSRFSRNLLDSIKYTRELSAYNVGVYFHANGINTYDSNSEFILNMMGSVAQEEVKRLSSRIKWGHKEAIKKGRVLGSSIITGYKKDNARLVIVEEEAKKIRKIFNLYASGKYGFHKLGLELYKQGISNYNGNIYDKDTLKRIIQNPKYKGYYRGHTTETIDYITKKRINIPIEEQIIYKDKNIPPIISEEIWDKANSILNNRSKMIKTSHGTARSIERKYPYTSKIFCGDHNAAYNRISSNKRKLKARWACCNYIKYGLNVCESPIIYEKDLDNIFCFLMKKMFSNKEEIIKEMLNYYSNLKIDNNFQTRISNIKKEKKDLKYKKEKLLELNIDGSINNCEFKERNNEYNDRILLLNKKLKEIEQIKTLENHSNISILERNIIEQFNYENNINEFVDNFLEEIIVYKRNNDRHKLLLKIYFNLRKQHIPLVIGPRHINDDLIPVYSGNIKTVDYKRYNFKKNCLNIDIYMLT